MQTPTRAVNHGLGPKRRGFGTASATSVAPAAGAPTSIFDRVRTRAKLPEDGPAKTALPSTAAFDAGAPPSSASKNMASKSPKVCDSLSDLAYPADIALQFGHTAKARIENPHEWRKLSVSALKSLKFLKATDIDGILAACAKMGWRNVCLLKATAEALRFLVEVKRYDIQTTASICQHWRMLEFRPTSAILNVILPALYRQMRSHPVKTRDLGFLFRFCTHWGLHEMQGQRGGKILHGNTFTFFLYEMSLRRVGTMRGTDLHHFAHSAFTMGGEAAVFDRIGEQFLRAATTSQNGMDWASFFGFSLTVMRLQDRRAMVQLAGGGTAGEGGERGGERRSGRSEARKLLKVETVGSFGEASRTGAARTGSGAAASSSFSPITTLPLGGEAYFHVLETKTLDRLSDLKPAEIVTVLHILGRYQRCSTKLLASLGRSVEANLLAFTLRQWGGVLRSFLAFDGSRTKQLSLFHTLVKGGGEEAISALLRARFFDSTSSVGEGGVPSTSYQREREQVVILLLLIQALRKFLPKYCEQGVGYCYRKLAELCERWAEDCSTSSSAVDAATDSALSRRTAHPAHRPRLRVFDTQQGRAGAGEQDMSGGGSSADGGVDGGASNAAQLVSRIRGEAASAMVKEKMEERLAQQKEKEEASKKKSSTAATDCVGGGGAKSAEISIDEAQMEALSRMSEEVEPVQQRSSAKKVAEEGNLEIHKNRVRHRVEIKSRSGMVISYPVAASNGAEQATGHPSNFLDPYYLSAKRFRHVRATSYLHHVARRRLERRYERMTGAKRALLKESARRNNINSSTSAGSREKDASSFATLSARLTGKAVSSRLLGSGRTLNPASAVFNAAMREARNSAGRGAKAGQGPRQGGGLVSKSMSSSSSSKTGGTGSGPSSQRRPTGRPDLRARETSVKGGRERPIVATRDLPWNEVPTARWRVRRRISLVLHKPRFARGRFLRKVGGTDDSIRGTSGGILEEAVDRTSDIADAPVEEQTAPGLFDWKISTAFVGGEHTKSKKSDSQLLSHMARSLETDVVHMLDAAQRRRAARRSRTRTGSAVLVNTPLTAVPQYTRFARALLAGEASSSAVRASLTRATEALLSYWTQSRLPSSRNVPLSGVRDLCQLVCELSAIPAGAGGSDTSDDMSATRLDSLLEDLLLATPGGRRLWHSQAFFWDSPEFVGAVCRRVQGQSLLGVGKLGEEILGRLEDFVNSRGEGVAEAGRVLELWQREVSRRC